MWLTSRNSILSAHIRSKHHHTRDFRFLWIICLASVIIISHLHHSVNRKVLYSCKISNSFFVQFHNTDFMHLVFLVQLVQFLQAFPLWKTFSTILSTFPHTLMWKAVEKGGLVRYCLISWWFLRNPAERWTVRRCTVPPAYLPRICRIPPQAPVPDSTPCMPHKGLPPVPAVPRAQNWGGSPCGSPHTG